MSYVTKRSFPFETEKEERLSKKFKADCISKIGYNKISKDQATLNKKLNTTMERVSLAEKVRPTGLSTFVGQKQVVGSDSVLHCLLKKGQVPSMILWGPSGCGKSSLANIIASIVKDTLKGKLNTVKLSSASCGIRDIKEIVNTAKSKSKFGWHTIVLMEEIHRFNKLQQDIFLPHIECGTFTLIGMTRENPSYCLNPALFSRCRAFALDKLTPTDLMEVLQKGVRVLEGKINDLPEHKNNAVVDGASFAKNEKKYKFLIDKETVNWLISACDGDACIALNSLELTVQTKLSKNNMNNQNPLLNPEDLERSLLSVYMLSDNEIKQTHHIYSALHKSIRANQQNAALYWLARVMAAKEDPVYIARRLVRISSEDIGLADPDALRIAIHTLDGCQMIGMPECDVLLGQCVIYLARAQKSSLVYNAMKAAQKFVSEHADLQQRLPFHHKSKEPGVHLYMGHTVQIPARNDGSTCLNASGNPDSFNFFKEHYDLPC